VKRIVTQTVLLLSVLVLFSGCASKPASKAPAPRAQAPAAAPSNIYAGTAESESLLKAMNGAKMDAVRKAVIDMIGASQEQANKAKLTEVLYSTANPNAYVDNNAMETLRKDKIGEKFIYEIRIPVNRQAVENTLKANGLLGAPAAQTPPRAAAEAAVKAETAPPPAAPPATAKEIDEPVKYEEATPEEKNFLRRYVDGMTYMVFFNEESKEDPFLMKAAVGMANSYLVSNGKNAVDYAEVEKLKKDQKLVYEEEVGQEMSMIQWIAQKLNADVYIEVDAVTEGESQGGNHYGSAKVNLKMFESSTGNLLGAVPYSSPRTFSKASQFDAKSNALQSTLYKAMPVAVDQSKGLLSKAFERGLRYDLIIQNTSDSRLMTRFRTRLRSKVKDIQVVSQSAEQTKYAVFIFGRMEDLEEIIYETADSVPGLEGMEQVLMRGKSLTFNSGLR
jgi:hypothetical protein